MQFLTSERGNNKLVHEGYIYTRQKTLSNQAIAWTCELKPNCKSRVSTLDNSIMKGPTEHSHTPDPSRIQYCIARSEMKKLATTTQMKPTEIISNTSRFLTELVKN